MVQSVGGWDETLYSHDKIQNCESAITLKMIVKNKRPFNENRPVLPPQELLGFYRHEGI